MKDGPHFGRFRYHHHHLACFSFFSPKYLVHLALTVPPPPPPQHLPTNLLQGSCSRVRHQILTEPPPCHETRHQRPIKEGQINTCESYRLPIPHTGHSSVSILRHAQTSCKFRGGGRVGPRGTKMQSCAGPSDQSSGSPRTQRISYLLLVRFLPHNIDCTKQPRNHKSTNGQATYKLNKASTQNTFSILSAVQHITSR